MASIVVHNVLFRPDDLIEITYAEQREQSDHVNVVRTVVFDREELRSEIADVEANLLDLVDAALTLLRNPPETTPDRRQG